MRVVQASIGGTRCAAESRCRRSGPYSRVWGGMVSGRRGPGLSDAPLPPKTAQPIAHAGAAFAVARRPPGDRIADRSGRSALFPAS